MLVHLLSPPISRMRRSRVDVRRVAGGTSKTGVEPKGEVEAVDEARAREAVQLAQAVMAFVVSEAGQDPGKYQEVLGLSYRGLLLVLHPDRLVGLPLSDEESAAIAEAQRIVEAAKSSARPGKAHDKDRVAWDLMRRRACDALAKRMKKQQTEAARAENAFAHEVAQLVEQLAGAQLVAKELGEVVAREHREIENFWSALDAAHAPAPSAIRAAESRVRTALSQVDACQSPLELERAETAVEDEIAALTRLLTVGYGEHIVCARQAWARLVQLGAQARNLSLDLLGQIASLRGRAAELAPRCLPTFSADVRQRFFHLRDQVRDVASDLPALDAEHGFDSGLATSVARATEQLDPLWNHLQELMEPVTSQRDNLRQAADRVRSSDPFKLQVANAELKAIAREFDDWARQQPKRLWKADADYEAKKKQISSTGDEFAKRLGGVLAKLSSEGRKAVHDDYARLAHYITSWTNQHYRQV